MNHRLTITLSHKGHVLRRVGLLILPLLTLAFPAHAQFSLRKIYEPAGETLEKALRASTLGQPGAKPFHIRVEISQTQGPPGDYNAIIEETWISPTQWVRTVKTSKLMQETLVEGSGVRVFTKGNYFPAWLRNYVTAVFDPVPEPLRRRLEGATIEHAEFGNGMVSSPCQHVEFSLGAAPAQQVNFANACFRRTDKLVELAQSPDYSMEFADYAKFDGLEVARSLSGSAASPGVRLIGKVTTLENVKTPAPGTFDVPSDGSRSDPLFAATVPTETLLQMAGGTPQLRRPRDASGHGMFTAWVCVDRNGQVQEAHPLNSDDSGIAADMTRELIGMSWKAFVQNGVPVQAQGALVFSY